MTFMEHQCSDLMKPILSVGLPKIGCNRLMPCAVVHGPLKRAGLNIPHLYTEQFITQLTMLLRHGPCASKQTGLLIRALAEAMQLETGLAVEPMQMPCIFEPLITNTWLKQLWTDCLQYWIHIQTDLSHAKPNRLNYIEFMQAFAQQGYRGQDLCELNCC